MPHAAAKVLRGVKGDTVHHSRVTKVTSRECHDGVKGDTRVHGEAGCRALPPPPATDGERWGAGAPEWRLGHADDGILAMVESSSDGVPGTWLGPCIGMGTPPPWMDRLVNARSSECVETPWIAGCSTLRSIMNLVKGLGLVMCRNPLDSP